MRPGAAVVGYAVAAGVGGNEGLLLAAVEFALGRVDGVGVGRHSAAIGILVYLLSMDVFPS